MEGISLRLFLQLIYFLFQPFDSTINPVFDCDDKRGALSLLITIDGIEDKLGSIQICLVSDETQFLKECSLHESILVSGERSIQYRFENLLSGQYAISLFHDLNQNQLLDKRSLLPIPKEPFGFSNNPRLSFGPPSFADCLFDLTKTDQEIVIRLRRL